jgi:hypothetical protein
MLIDGRGKTFSLPFLLLQNSVETLLAMLREHQLLQMV